MIDNLGQNFSIENVPERFVELVANLKLRKRDIRKTMLKIIHNNFCSDNESDVALMEICEYMCFLSDDCYRMFFVYLIGSNGDINDKELNLISAVFEMINCCVTNKLALPDMENDDFIDKKKSCHKKFGNGKTMLAIDVMESLAIKTITLNNFFNEKQKCNMIEIINNYLGKDGVCGGQIMKILCKKKKVYKDEITRIKHMTVNTYFKACVDCVDVISHYTQKQINILKSYTDNVCSLLDIINNGNFADKNITCDVLQKAKLFANQGKIIIDKKFQNGKMMQNFIEYLYYNIEQRQNVKQSNSPIIIQSETAML